MSSARGQANHSLYLARILIAAWRRELSGESVPASVLAQAYLPGIRGHLRNGYGWFLVEITRPGAVPLAPPGCVAELPEVSAGKSVPPEVREFQRLEASGWIADMLATDMPGAVTTASSGNLATPSLSPEPAQAEQWADQLQGLFDRMADSLDEY